MACRGASTPTRPSMGWEAAEPARDARAHCIIAASMLVFVVNVVSQPAARRARRRTIPGGAATLEWATTSPPPPYNFAAPVVASRAPLWETGRFQSCRGTGCRNRVPTALVTRMHDAEPDHVPMPIPSRRSGRCWRARHHWFVHRHRLHAVGADLGCDTRDHRAHRLVLAHRRGKRAGIAPSRSSRKQPSSASSRSGS